MMIAFLVLTFSSCRHGSTNAVTGESSAAEALETDIPGESTDSGADTEAESNAADITVPSAGVAAATAPASRATIRKTQTTASPTAVSASPSNIIQYPEMSSDLPPLAKSVDNSLLYYRSLLSPDEQQLYDFFLYYAERFDERLISVPGLTNNHYLEIAGCLFKDNPQLFWLRESPDLPEGYGIDDHVFRLDYWFTRSEAVRMQAEIDAKTNSILAGVPAGGSQYDTELYLHDYLINHCTFAWGNQWGDNSCNIYGALLNDRPASEAYARGMQYLLEKEKIPCLYVFGTAVGGHAWNIVSIDRAYYQLDVTRDDPDSAYCSSLSHQYFNVTTKQMLAEGRKMETYENYREFPLPDCTATADNYYVKSGGAR